MESCVRVSSQSKPLTSGYPQSVWTNSESWTSGCLHQEGTARGTGWICMAQMLHCLCTLGQRLMVWCGVLHLSFVCMLFLAGAFSAVCQVGKNEILCICSVGSFLAYSKIMLLFAVLVSFQAPHMLCSRQWQCLCFVSPWWAVYSHACPQFLP